MRESPSFRLLPKWTLPALIAGIAVISGIFVLVKPSLFSSQYVSEVTQRTFIQAPTPVPGNPVFYSLSTREPVSLDQWRGRYLLIYFWATWCPPCIGELPLLHQLAVEWRDAPLTILPVHLDEEFELNQAALFLRELGITIPAYVDLNEELEQALPLSLVPSTFLLDPEGRIQVMHRGPENWASDELRKFLSDRIGWKPEPASN